MRNAGGPVCRRFLTAGEQLHSICVSDVDVGKWLSVSLQTQKLCACEWVHYTLIVILPVRDATAAAASIQVYGAPSHLPCGVVFLQLRRFVSVHISR